MTHAQLRRACNDESSHESVASQLDPNEVGVELHVTRRDGLDGHRHQLVHEHPATIHVQRLPLRLDHFAALHGAQWLIHVRQQFRRHRHRAVEQLRVEPDQTARIVIDERSGIIVMGRDVRVSTVAVAQGNLTVTITEQPQVSQPAPLSNGTSTVVPRTGVKVDTGDGNKLALVKEGVTLRELVDGLNALGIGPRDLISILQAIKTAGALQADIEVM